MMLLIFSYVAIAALLLNLGLRSSWPNTVKIAAIVITTAFYFITYNSLKDLSGWPSDQALPNKFEIIGTFTEEKNDATKGIYVWVKDLSQENPIPRAYKLPYTKATHKVADKTSKKRQDGETVTAKKQGSGAPGEGTPTSAFRLTPPPKRILPEK